MAIQANDFKSNTLTGTITVSGGSFALPLQTNRLILEGDKSFIVRFRKDNAEGITIAQTPTITITDNTSVDAFYANVGTIEEGSYVNFALQTSNVPNNYAMFYTIANVSGELNSDDVSPFSGTTYIIDNSSNITILATADLSTYADDNESFEIKLRSQSTSGDIIATSNTVSILDTSNSARITGISITRNTALASPYLYEGETLYANISTINGAGENSATFYYSAAGNAILYGANAGSFVINDNEGSFAITLETDIPLNEQRHLQLQIRRNSTTGAILDTTNAFISTNYTSGIYYGVISRIDNIYPNVTTGYGEDTFLFTVDTINSYENETLYYRTTGNAAVQTGSFSVSGNTATVAITVENNDVPKTLGLDIYRTNSYNALLGQSNSEIYFVPNYVQFVSVEPFEERIVESEAFSINVNTAYGRPGSPSSNLFYTLAANGEIASGLSGEFDPASALIIEPETNIPDGEEVQVQFNIRTVSTGGPIEYTSNLLAVESYTNQENVNSVVALVTSITPNVQGFYYADSIGFNVATIGAENNETLYYSTTGNLLQGEATGGNTGSFIVTSNVGHIIIKGNGTAAADRQFAVEVRRGSSSGTILNTSSNVNMSSYSGAMQATGGTIEDSGGYRKHIFTTTANLVITQAAYNPTYTTMDYFFVGGGGGGGGSSYGGGGGGGGGFLQSTAPIKGIQGEFIAVVGAGGGNNAPGGNTYLTLLNPTTIYAAGGGSGGGIPGSPGGSGGGCTNALVPGTPTAPGGTALQPTIGGFGNPGGLAYLQQDGYPSGQKGSAGGGGGAGSAGESATSTTDSVKNGGAGRAGPLSPSSYGGNNAQMSYPNPAPATTPTGGTRYFAGGGGGSAEQGVTCSSLGGTGGGGAANPSASYPNPAGGGGGRSGIASSGGGGGGGAHGPAPGGSGGGGIIIIRYPI